MNIQLTERQIEVQQLVARGATKKEIAHKLDISEGTAKNYISTILTKPNLRDRTQAAILHIKIIYSNLTILNAS